MARCVELFGGFRQLGRMFCVGNPMLPGWILTGRDELHGSSHLDLVGSAYKEISLRPIEVNELATFAGVVNDRLYASLD